MEEKWFAKVRRFFLLRVLLVSFPGCVGGGTHPENEPVPNLTGRALEVNLSHMAWEFLDLKLAKALWKPDTQEKSISMFIALVIVNMTG